MRKKDQVHEVHEDSFYVMQMLQLKDEDCLTFYDRGANQHLISGELAEKIHAKVVSDRPGKLGIVGGGQIWTEYGKYKMMIGPTTVGEYHEITAQGISHVTDSFPYYDLKEVNEELNRSGYLPRFDLPKYIGGDRVKLLIGLKDPELEPQWLFSLPSGIGVYKSTLTDKFNSRICYGGPHRLFSRINKKLKGNFNHINVFFSELVSQYRNSPYPAIAKGLEQEMVEYHEDAVCSKKLAEPSSKIETVFPEIEYADHESTEDYVNDLVAQVACSYHDPTNTQRAEVSLQGPRVSLDQNVISYTDGQERKYRATKKVKNKMQAE